MLEQRSGFRVLNDEYGLMLYESEPSPRFVTFNVKGLRGVSQSHFEQVFVKAIGKAKHPNPKKMLALDLFNASFFQRSADSRFLVLVMAIEALLAPTHRSRNAVAHIEAMIAATEESRLLSNNEKSSLTDSLKWLKYESINQSGRNLASSRLGERRYMGKKGPAFFSHCYRIRSRLVHR